jgi:hypothetical protein
MQHPDFTWQLARDRQARYGAAAGRSRRTDDTSFGRVGASDESSAPGCPAQPLSARHTRALETMRLFSHPRPNRPAG